MMSTNNHGLTFVDFVKVDDLDRYHPLDGSFAVVECDGKYLLCYNIWRRQWELPAGKREGKETPEACAVRELYEETGQKFEGMQFLGVLVTETMNGMIKHNPVYFVKMEQLQPFRENAETSAIRLWDGKEEIGAVDAVDIRILDYI